jgi:hypothetical protein
MGATVRRVASTSRDEKMSEIRPTPPKRPLLKLNPVATKVDTN